MKLSSHNFIYFFLMNFSVKGFEIVRVAKFPNLSIIHFEIPFQRFTRTNQLCQSYRPVDRGHIATNFRYGNSLFFSAKNLFLHFLELSYRCQTELGKIIFIELLLIPHLNIRKQSHKVAQSHRVFFKHLDVTAIWTISYNLYNN